MANLRLGHRLLIAGAGFLAAAWQDVPIRIEGDLDAGVAHLIANLFDEVVARARYYRHFALFARIEDPRLYLTATTAFH